MRPISPVVDATNYAMLELGQPMHAFDLPRLAGPGIVVRRSEPGERLVTLDGVERELDDDVLICDLDGPVALGGVMGGAGSEVTAGTRDVLLESAYFEPKTILRTSRRLQLLTEASVRFSRGTDPEGVAAAAARAARLIIEWTGGEVLRGPIDVGEPPPRRHIDVRPERASAVLGYAVDAPAAIEALARIEIPAVASNGHLRVEAPSFRPDLAIEVDVIEEIVRVQGYDQLPSTVPGIRRTGGEQASYRARRRVRELLVRAGLREAASLTFGSSAHLEFMGHEGAVAVANPPSAEEPFLRTSLVPRLLEAVGRNLDRGARAVSLFEVGHVFRLAEPVDEREHVAIVLAGQVGDGLHAEDREFDVLDAKGVVEHLLDGLGVTWELGPAADRPFHPGRAASVLVQGRPAGVFGELDPVEAARLDVAWRVALAELDLTTMGTLAAAVSFRDVPRFPPVRRDLAFVVAEELPAGALHVALEAAAGELLDRSSLFDVFRGGAVPGGRKSLAFALEFRAPDRTLTDEEIEPVIGAVVDRLRAEFGAELRV
jgi:phenylalanyl-tRNA synthetase beta chain